MWTFRRSLRNALASEAKAYGFTLVIWGTGALVIGRQGFPSPPQVFAYVGGVLAAMALLLLIAFGDLRRRWTEEDPVRFAFGAIHVISVLVALLVAWWCATFIPGTVGFFLTPFLAVSVHQLLLAAEIRASLCPEARSEDSVD
jgi:hypothetical protein